MAVTGTADVVAVAWQRRALPSPYPSAPLCNGSFPEQQRAPALNAVLVSHADATCTGLPKRSQLDGNKVLSRSRGFTVDTCVSAVDEDMESPEFQGLPPGDKVRRGGGAWSTATSVVKMWETLRAKRHRPCEPATAVSDACAAAAACCLNTLNLITHPAARRAGTLCDSAAAVWQQSAVQACNWPRAQAGVRHVLQGGVHRSA